MQCLQLGQKQQEYKPWSKILKFYVLSRNPTLETLLSSTARQGQRVHGVLFTLTWSCSSAPENIVPASSVCLAISLSLFGDCWRHCCGGLPCAGIQNLRIPHCWSSKFRDVSSGGTKGWRSWRGFELLLQSVFCESVKVYRIGSSCIFGWGLWEQGGQPPRKNFDCSWKNKVFI